MMKSQILVAWQKSSVWEKTDSPGERGRAPAQRSRALEDKWLLCGGCVLASCVWPQSDPVCKTCSRESCKEWTLPLRSLTY